MIKSHGAWKRYTPGTEDRIPDAPYSTMYARREGDGMDWYKYVHPGNQFVLNTLKITCRWDEGYNSWVVVVPTYIADELFPDDRTIYELDAPVVPDPITAYGNKLFDPATGTFTDPPPPVFPPSDAEKRMASTFDSIMERLDKLEKRL